MTRTRHFVQNTGFVCRGIRHSLPGPAMELGFRLQLYHEAVLHRQQLLHPLPHEGQVQVRQPPPRFLCTIVAKARLPRPTHDPSIDTFKIEYLLGPCVVLGLIFNYKFTLAEVLWSFSIYLESVAILPQLFLLQRTGEAETITTHYLAALGAYRAFYIPNWIYRYAWPLPPKSCINYDEFSHVLK